MFLSWSARKAQYLNDLLTWPLSIAWDIAAQRLNAPVPISLPQAVHRYRSVVHILSLLILCFRLRCSCVDVWVVGWNLERNRYYRRIDQSFVFRRCCRPQRRRAKSFVKGMMIVFSERGTLEENDNAICEHKRRPSKALLELS